MGCHRKWHQLAVRREGLRHRAMVGVAALVLLALGVGFVGWMDARGPADGAAPDEASTLDVGSLLVEAPVGAEVRDLVDAMGAGSAQEPAHVSELPVAEEADRLLGDYAGRKDCIVAQSGWLDLLGRTWGCVIQGEGWVDLCVVSEREAGGSEVGVMRMDASGLSGEGEG